MKGLEIAFYAVALLLLTFLVALLPHCLAYGWAWGAPLPDLGYMLLALVLPCASAAAALVWAIAARRRPGTFLRVGMVPVLLLAPEVVFGLLGGLKRSQGRGLAARATASADDLQGWALPLINQGVSPESLPQALASRLPRGATLRTARDHVEMRWYDCGILVGDRAFRGNEHRFFFATVRPGVHVFVDER